VSQSGIDFRQLNYQWLVVNLWRDNEEHNKSVEEQVIGSEEDAEETRDEDQEEGDLIPNIEIDDDNGDYDLLDSEYEKDNEMK